MENTKKEFYIKALVDVYEDSYTDGELEWVNYYKIEPKDIWIISDDVDLPFGVVRSRFGGSDGGHNGIKSIITHLKTEDINRIRVGIGRNDHKDTADYVLAKFTQNEQKTLTDIVDKTALFVIDLLSRGMRVETHKF